MRHTCSKSSKSRSRPSLVQLTKLYLGRAFEENACGDGLGSGLDERPMDKWDTLDCTTYVEAVLSKYLGGPSRAGQRRALVALRYNRSPSTFLNRNHFLRHSWIRNAIRKGILTELTESIFGSSNLNQRTYKYRPSRWFVRVAKHRIRSTSDSKVLLEQIGAAAAAMPVVISVHNVLLLTKLAAAFSPRLDCQTTFLSQRLKKVPNGTLIIFLGRQAEHAAWLIRKRDRLYIRHACRGSVVREDSLATFLKLQRLTGWYLDSLLLFRVVKREKWLKGQCTGPQK